MNSITGNNKLLDKNKSNENVKYYVTVEIVEKDAKYIKGNNTTLTFSQMNEINSAIKGVKIDGKIINNSDYDLINGNTITLKKVYLETLSNNKHTITFIYEDGVETAPISFTILAAQETENGENKETTPTQPADKEENKPITNDTKTENDTLPNNNTETKKQTSEIEKQPSKTESNFNKETNTNVQETKDVNEKIIEKDTTSPKAIPQTGYTINNYIIRGMIFILIFIMGYLVYIDRTKLKYVTWHGEGKKKK